jgi:hypothetical protein
MYFCVALEYLAYSFWPNLYFLLVHCSGKLYGRAADNFLDYMYMLLDVTFWALHTL